MFPESQVKGSLCKTRSKTVNALSSMQQNSLCYSKTEFYTLSEAALKSMLSVIDNVENSLQEILNDIAIFECSNVSVELSGHPQPSGLKCGVNAAKRVVDNARDVIGGILKTCNRGFNLSSYNTWSHDILSLSPKLCGCIVEMHTMYSTLYNGDGSVYHNYSLSINAENAIMSLAHLTNTVHRLCCEKVSASSKDIALLNTSTRSVLVITESLRQLAMLVNQEMADRIQRCTMLMASASLLVSPFTPTGCVSNVKPCAADVVRSAKILANDVGYTSMRDTTLVPMANGLKSIIEYAVGVYISVHERVFVGSEKERSSAAPMSYEGLLLTPLKKSDERTGDVLFVRTELLEAVLHASLFELWYLDSSHNERTLEEKGATIERHMRDLKWSLMYALVGACECSFSENSDVVNELIMGCVSDASYFALESLRHVVNSVDNQPFSHEEKKRALKSLGSVSTLVNRILDRLDGKRELYSHNWHTEVSGVMLFPGELPENRRLLQTTAKSSLVALRESFEVKKGPLLDSVCGVLKAIIACIVKLLVWILSFSDYVVSCMAGRSEDTQSQYCDDISGNMACGSLFGEEYLAQDSGSQHSIPTYNPSLDNVEEAPLGMKTKIRSDLFVNVQECSPNSIKTVSNDAYEKGTSQHEREREKSNGFTNSDDDAISNSYACELKILLSSNGDTKVERCQHNNGGCFAENDSSSRSVSVDASCPSPVAENAEKVKSSLVGLSSTVADVVKKGNNVDNGHTLSHSRGI